MHVSASSTSSRNELVRFRAHGTWSAQIPQPKTQPVDYGARSVCGPRPSPGGRRGRSTDAGGGGRGGTAAEDNTAFGRYNFVRCPSARNGYPLAPARGAAVDVEFQSTGRRRTFEARWRAAVAQQPAPEGSFSSEPTRRHQGELRVPPAQGHREDVGSHHGPGARQRYRHWFHGRASQPINASPRVQAPSPGVRALSKPHPPLVHMPRVAVENLRTWTAVCESCGFDLLFIPVMDLHKMQFPNTPAGTVPVQFTTRCVLCSQTMHVTKRPE